MVRYKLNREAHLDRQPRLFELSDRTDRKHPNHVCIVTWTDGTLSILAQAPVPHADLSDGRRVLFVDHKAGKPPVLEAIAIAKKIAHKNADTGASGPLVLA